MKGLTKMPMIHFPTSITLVTIGAPGSKAGFGMTEDVSITTMGVMRL